ncbi:hypothetical protein B0H17DRAFT_1146452 [Mycena rosella]|uniref:DUF7029 domain-containing protein n=1 Tax=Mycena rosella TaxID=1033263 RepID=A0AAD7G3J4_MYCRO|nr:hypothetical protein B0H17DRAFT_1146452 [Mycena rosella]
MYYIYLAAFFLGCLLNVFAIPSAISTQVLHPHTEAPVHHLTLHPGIHPDEDLSDLNNLKAKKASSLYYVAPPGSTVGGASVVELTHLYPAVSLERSHFVTSVTCDATSTSITVTFADGFSFRTAFDDWKTHRTGFLLISYVPGCGSGTDSLERSFHLISGIVGSQKDRRIVCQAKAIPIHRTIHHDQEIRVHAATYEVKSHQGGEMGADSHSAPPTNTSLVLATPNTRTSDLAVHIYERGFFDFVVKVLKVLKKFYPPAIIIGYVADQFAFNKQVVGRATFDTQQIAPFNGTFESEDDSYLLYRKEFGAVATKRERGGGGTRPRPKPGTNSTSTTDKSIEFLCVGCGIRIDVYLTANLVGTFGSGFVQANVKVEANVTATLVLGIKANYEYSDSKNLTTIQAPIPHASLLIPKILEIGAFAVLDIGLDYKLNLQGLLKTGFFCVWTNVGASLDLKNPSNSALLGNWGVGSNCHRVVDAKVELTMEIVPFVKFGLQIKASVLSDVTDKLSGQLSLVEKVGIKLTAKVSTKPDKCPRGIPKFSGDLTSLLYITATGLTDIPLHDEFLYHLFAICLKWGILRGHRDLTDDNNSDIIDGVGNLLPGPGTGPQDVDNSKPRGTTIRWGTPDTTVTWAESSVLVRNDELNPYSPPGGGFGKSPPWLSQDSVVYATSSGDFLCAASSFITDYGFAKLETMSRVGDGYIELGLGYPANGTAYIVAADTVNTYHLIICSHADGFNHVYVANSTKIRHGLPGIPLDKRMILFGDIPEGEFLCGDPYLTPVVEID